MRGRSEPTGAKPADETFAGLLTEIAVGECRTPNAPLRVLPAPPGPAMAIIGAPGMHVVASSAPESWVRERLAGDLMGPLSPAFIVELGRELNRADDGVDLVLAAPALAGESSLRPARLDEHPRVARAAAHRVELRTFHDDAGEAVVIVGRGLGMRFEVGVEVAPAARGRGVGSRAFHEARRLIPVGEFLFAQIAPANTASLRALLRAGFTPVGAEVLFFEGPRARA